jgi:hypothetical protein
LAASSTSQGTRGGGGGRRVLKLSAHVFDLAKEEEEEEEEEEESDGRRSMLIHPFLSVWSRTHSNAHKLHLTSLDIISHVFWSKITKQSSILQLGVAIIQNWVVGPTKWKALPDNLFLKKKERKKATPDIEKRRRHLCGPYLTVFSASF